MNNDNDNPPITASQMQDAMARRLAYFAQPIAPAPRAARRDIPRRNRNHSVKHRAIR